MEEYYSLRYKRGDFEIELKGEREWIEQKYKELIQLQIKGPELEIQKKDLETSLPMSLAEYINSKTKTDLDTNRIIIFAYWLYYKQKYNAFNVKDIKNCYLEVRVPVPSNPSKLLNDLQASGYLMRTNEKKENMIAWTITPTGEKYVQDI